MRKVVASMFMALDGVIQEPMWSLPYWNDEIAKFKYNELFSSDALLLGKLTYEGFAEAWPGRTDEQGYAERINGLPKYVVSSTLQKADWGATTIIKSNFVEEVAKLRQQDGQNILIFGSARLINGLMKHNLIDVYNILLYPLVLGKGQRLFEDGSEAKLKLVESTSYSSGAVSLVYETAPNT